MYKRFSEDDFFHRKGPHPGSFVFRRWDWDTGSDQSPFSPSVLQDEGKVTPCISNLRCGRIPNISFFEMQPFLTFLHIERAADLVWGAFTATFSCIREDTVVIYR